MNQNRNMNDLHGYTAARAIRYLPRRRAARAVLEGPSEKFRMPESVFKIVLADSFIENRRILEQALCCCPSFALVQRMQNISELVSYLAGTGKFVDKDEFPQPDLVLLDLNLSGRRSAFEVLKWVQAQTTRLYRIVIFSPGANDLECEEAYALGADGFVTKPGSVSEMVVALTRIEGWLKSSIEDADEFCVA